MISNMFFHKEGFVTPNKIDFLSMDHSTSSKKAKSVLGYAPIISAKDGVEYFASGALPIRFLAPPVRVAAPLDL